jgi:hypothetical protein
MKKRKTTQNETKKLLSRLVDLQLEAQKLPQLPAVEKAKLDQNIAIEQLYYSSKLEGSILTEKIINKAIHEEKLPAT